MVLTRKGGTRPRDDPPRLCRSAKRRVLTAAQGRFQVRRPPRSRSAALRAVDAAQGRLLPPRPRPTAQATTAPCAVVYPSPPTHTAPCAVQRLEALRIGCHDPGGGLLNPLGRAQPSKSRGHDPREDPTPRSRSAVVDGHRHGSLCRARADTALCAALSRPRHNMQAWRPLLSVQCTACGRCSLCSAPPRDASMTRALLSVQCTACGRCSLCSAPPQDTDTALAANRRKMRTRPWPRSAKFLPHFVPPANCIGLSPHLVQVLSRELDLRRVL